MGTSCKEDMKSGLIEEMACGVQCWELDIYLLILRGVSPCRGCHHAQEGIAPGLCSAGGGMFAGCSQGREPGTQLRVWLCHPVFTEEKPACQVRLSLPSFSACDTQNVEPLFLGSSVETWNL